MGNGLVCGRPDRLWLAALALCLTVPLAYGLAALGLGQDSSWDLRNYHWYNGYAFWNNRLGLDIAPAMAPTYYNPNLDLLFYPLANALPPRLTGFVLGAIQGLNFIPLFIIAWQLFRLAHPGWRLAVSFALAGTGLLGAGTLGELGTVFYDNVVSISALSALAIFALAGERMRLGSTGEAVTAALLAGLCAGVGVGLKQTAVIYCAGACLAFLFVPTGPARRVTLALAFGVGAAVAMVALSAHWMWTLWQTFGSPVFPMMNQLLESPYAPPSSGLQTGFLPSDLWTALSFPFQFSADPMLVGEKPWQDFRIATVYGLGALAAAAAVARRPGRRPDRPQPERPPDSLNRELAIYLVAAIALTYILWLKLFSIYRYVLVIEMLAPILLALGLLTLGLRQRTCAIVTAATVMVWQGLTVPANWGRVDWGRQWIDAQIPAIAHPERTVILMSHIEPLAYLIPSFPPNIPFLRYSGWWEITPAFRRRIAAAVADPSLELMILIQAENLDDDEAARMAPLGLRADVAGCRTLTSNLKTDKVAIHLCPLIRL